MKKLALLTALCLAAAFASATGTSAANVTISATVVQSTTISETGAMTLSLDPANATNSSTLGTLNYSVNFTAKIVLSFVKATGTVGGWTVAVPANWSFSPVFTSNSSATLSGIAPTNAASSTIRMDVTGVAYTDNYANFGNGASGSIGTLTATISP